MSCSTRMMALTPAALAAPIRVFISPCFSAVDTPEVGSSSRITSGAARRRRRRRAASSRPATAGATVLASRCSRPKMPAISATRARDGRVRRDTPRAAATACPGCDHDGGGDGLGHGQLREDLHELEGARHAALGERHRADAGDVLALEEDLALGRHQQAGEQVDQRGLAGAVGPHDRDELALARPPPTRRRARGRRRSAWTRPGSRRAGVMLASSRRRPGPRTPGCDGSRQLHGPRHFAGGDEKEAPTSPARPASPRGKKMTTTARMAPSTKRQYCV